MLDAKELNPDLESAQAQKEPEQASAAAEAENYDRMTAGFAKILDWFSLPNTHFKLYGSVFAILTTSALNWSFLFLGPIVSTLFVGWGLMALKKLPATSNLNVTLTNNERYLLLGSAVANFALYLIAPPLYAAALVIGSGAFGYFYTQDVVLQPLTERNLELMALLKRTHEKNESDERYQYFAQLMEQGASPYIGLELNEEGEYQLNAILSTALPESMHAKILELLLTGIKAQEEHISFQSTLSKIGLAFWNNENLFKHVRALAPQANRTSRQFVSLGFSAVGELMSSVSQSLSHLKVWLQTLAPTTTDFEQENSLNDLAEQYEDTVTAFVSHHAKTLQAAGQAKLSVPPKEKQPAASHPQFDQLSSSAPEQVPQTPIAVVDPVIDPNIKHTI